MNEYGKPTMTNLPYDLGERIFNQILSTSHPDYEKLHQEARRMEKAIVAVRQGEDEKARSDHLQTPLRASS